MFFKIVEDRFEKIWIRGYVADNGDLYFRGLDVAGLLNYANRTQFVAARTRTRLADVVDTRVLKLPERVKNTFVFDMEKTIELLRKAGNLNVQIFAEYLDGTRATIIRLDGNEPSTDHRRPAAVQIAVKNDDDEDEYEHLMDFYVDFREKTFQLLERLRKKMIETEDLRGAMGEIDFNDPPPYLKITVDGTRLLYKFFGEEK